MVFLVIFGVVILLFLFFTQRKGVEAFSKMWTDTPNMGIALGDFWPMKVTQTKVSLDECKEKCEQDPRCKGLMYSPTGPAYCTLKREMNPDNKIAGAGSNITISEITSPDDIWVTQAGQYSASSNQIKTDLNLSLQGCKDACDKNGDCKAFMRDTNGTCYQVSNLWGPGWYANPGVNTYSKVAVSKKDGWANYTNLVVDGEDISKTPNLTSDQCKAACKANPACKAVSYGAEWTDQWGSRNPKTTCYQKSGWNNSRLDTRYTTSFVEPSYTMNPMQDFPRNDLESSRVSTKECETKCTANDACKAFTTGREGDKLCWLKSKATLKERVSNNNRNTYIKHSATPTPLKSIDSTSGNWTKKTLTAIPNPDNSKIIENNTSMNTTECKESCVLNPVCKGFTYYEYDNGGTLCQTSSSTDAPVSFMIDGQTATSYTLNVKPSDQMNTTEGKWTVAKGSKMEVSNSNLVKLPFDVEKAQDCRTDCEKTAGCKGTVVWKQGPDKTTCFHVNSLRGPVPNQENDTYALSDSTTVDGWTTSSNIVSGNAGVSGLDLVCNQTLDACKSACRSKEECKGFAYGEKWEDPNTKQCCYFKSNTEGTFIDSRYTTYQAGPLQVETTDGFWTKNTNTAYANPDGKTVLATHANLNDDACKYKCVTTKDCKGITNYAYEGGKSSCLLMSTTDDPRLYTKTGEKATSYKFNKPVSATDTSDRKWAVNQEFAYNSDTSPILGSRIDNSTVQDCKNKCEATPDCKAFGFERVTPTSNTCWLTAKLTGPGRYTHQLLDTYAKVETKDEGNWTSYSSVVPNGSDISATMGKTEAQCKELCSANPSCKAFAYGPDWAGAKPDEKGCYLNSGLDATILDTRYSTYIPDESPTVNSASAPVDAAAADVPASKNGAADVPASGAAGSGAAAAADVSTTD